MKKLLLIHLIAFALIHPVSAQFLQWARGMGGTGLDVSYAIATGASGSAYTTGKFEGPMDFDPGPGTYTLGTGGKIFISKLNGAGNFAWAKQLGPTNGISGYGITVDAAENLYITGEFTGSGDFDPGPGVFNLSISGAGAAFVAKYDSAGNFVWAKAILAASGGGASGSDIALDPSGNVLIVGHYFGTVDFDPGVGTYNLTTNALGDAYLCKLDPMGNFLWANGVGTPDAEGARALAVDNAGNAYFTSSYWGSQLDIRIYKFNAAGTYVWMKAVGGSGTDIGHDIAVDAAGSIYVTGSFEVTANFNPNGTFNLVSAGFTDGFILKLNASGNLVLAGRLGGTGSDAAYSIAVDGPGNSHITGSFQNTVDFDPGLGTFNMTSVGTQDACVLKIDAVGGLVFAVQFGGMIGGIGPRAIAITPSGDVLTTGTFSGSHDFDPGPSTTTLTYVGQSDIFTQKLGACFTPPAPTNTTPSNNLTVCMGNSAALTASGTGTLTWYNSPSGGTALATGSSFTTSALSSNTTYYVQDSACLASPRTAISVTVLAPTFATLSATACISYTSPSGNHVWTSSGSYSDTLTNSLGCDSVITVNLTIHHNTANILSPSACYSYVSPSGHIWTSSGSYLDTIPNATGCDSIITVQLTILGSSTSTISPSVCDFYTSPSGNYVWNASGTYMDTIPNVAGCDSFITIQLTITPVDVSVTNNSPTLVSNALIASYQWIYCDSVAIVGATNSSFTATVTGNYAVIVTQNGCTDTSACESVIVNGLPENNFSFRAYPNPTDGIVHVKWEGIVGEASITIRNSLGQVVTSEKISSGNGCELQIEGAKGIYFLEMRTEDGLMQVLKLVRNE